MSRFSIFLLVALLLGIALLVARFKAHEKDFGGFGRYRDRGNNAAAWKSYARYETPTPEAFLRDFCRRSCPDSSYARTLLPEDNFRHILLSFRDPAIEHFGDPVDAYAKAFHAETNLPMQGRLDAKSTLGDVLIVMNELLGPGMVERARQDSIFRLKKEAADWEKQYRQNRAKDSTIYAEQARAREAEERRKTQSQTQPNSFEPEDQEGREPGD